ncbi:o-succinylbenzoate synthase [Aestuariibaculum suncheonense]|uniref:O-succinylbenzoate synthase n=1 Tax=Aestuariibaculum suncheonense TaxID=1028745 RepID=A0A8J6UK25_9FLAO|nr:o-succinylbenzoate synthase [Aestuariibaculum suncheonense]MBD0835321.1 o-succinylbenzoate synthase [Aestuariibaculum suncheonense]
MISASYKKYVLNFKQASGTSRGVLRTKETWFLILNHNGKKGIGECGVFRGLSADDKPDYEDKLIWTCENIHLGLECLLETLTEYPSIQFGLETAFKSLKSQDGFDLFPSKFTREQAPIAINGLIWMGSEAFMKQQIEDKLKAGFSCIKMKIGAIDFQSEIDLLKSIRKEFSAQDIELRVDANGAFLPSEALEKLKMLSELELHSIEQPIKQGQIEDMARLCEGNPLPIALDEELIGVFHLSDRKALLQAIKPQYIILKPSLVGGFKGSDEWISIAENQNIGWWITSALESNIGLNAIAQYTYQKQSPLPQGLGTGGLFTNNFDSPLEVTNGALRYNNTLSWKFNL